MWWTQACVQHTDTCLQTRVQKTYTSLLFVADALFQMEAVSLSKFMWESSSLWQPLLYKILPCVRGPIETNWRRSNSICQQRECTCWALWTMRSSLSKGLLLYFIYNNFGLFCLTKLNMKKLLQFCMPLSLMQDIDSNVCFRLGSLLVHIVALCHAIWATVHLAKSLLKNHAIVVLWYMLSSVCILTT